MTDAATGLKLIEAGVPKETLAMLAVPMIPLQIILPWIISRYTSGTDGRVLKHTPKLKPQTGLPVDACTRQIFLPIM